MAVGQHPDLELAATDVEGDGVGGSRAGLTRRLLTTSAWTIVAILVLSLVTFAATNVKTPEDIARGIVGRQAPDASVNAFIERHGLEEPLPERYIAWLSGFVSGNWGNSLANNTPVGDVVLPRLYRSGLLVFSAVLIGFPLSIAFGAFLARHWGSRLDLTTNAGVMLIRAIPEFVVAIVLLLLFVSVLGWLPADSGTAILFGRPMGVIKGYALPVGTLIVASVPYLTRLTRAAFRDSLSTQHVRAARLRGLSDRRIVWRHAGLTAAGEVLAAGALTFVHIVGAAIVVENVFGFPGVGTVLVDAVRNGDTPTVQAITIVLGVVFICAFLLVDVLGMLVNPRLRQRSAL